MNNRENRGMRAFAAGASMLALLAGTPAFAQDAQATEDAAGVGDIIVTAQFRAQNLQDTPIAITAVTGEMMEAKSQTNLAQLADSAPNVSVKGTTSAFGPSVAISIRGAGQNDFNPAYEPGVAVYIDDVYYPQLTGAVFDLLDLDRVEILRGPQGTLTGRNSEGGALKMYSRKPTGDGGGYIEATYGSRQKIGLRASADFKVAENLFARVSGVFKEQDGYVKNLDFGCVYPAGGSATFTQTGGAVLPVNPVGGVARKQAANQGCLVDKLNGVGYQAVRGSLRYAPSERTEFTLSGDYVHDEHTIAGDVLLNVPTNINPNVIPAPGVAYDNRFICGRYCNFASTGQPAALFNSVIPPVNGTPLLETRGTNQSVYDGWGVSLRGEIGLTDNLTLTSITGYREFEATFDGDDDVSPANLGYGQNDLTNWNFSQELRLGAKLGEKVDFTLGGFYFKQRSVYFSYQDIRYINGPVGIIPLQFTQPDIIRANSKAAFAHVAFHPTEALTISGGARVTSEAKVYTYFRLNPDGTVNPFLDPAGAVGGIGSAGALSGSNNPYKKNGRFDWRVSVDYRISPQALVYANVATGFKGGGTNPRPFNVAQAKIGFTPETLVAYEIGAKTDLLDRQLRINVAAFLNKFKDLQVPSLFCNTPNPADATPCAARTNAADSTVKGFEVETALNLHGGLSVDASMSHIINKFRNLAAGSAFPANPGGIVANDPGVAPKWKYAIGAQYAVDLGDSGSITPRVDWSYQSSQYTGASVAVGLPVTLANRVRSFIPSYGLLNARITYRSADKDWELALEGTNLTKKYYLNSVFDLSGIGISKRGNPGAPREFAVSVKRKF